MRGAFALVGEERRRQDVEPEGAVLQRRVDLRPASLGVLSAGEDPASEGYGVRDARIVALPAEPHDAQAAVGANGDDVLCAGALGLARPREPPHRLDVLARADAVLEEVGTRAGVEERAVDDVDDVLARAAALDDERIGAELRNGEAFDVRPMDPDVALVAQHDPLVCVRRAGGSLVRNRPELDGALFGHCFARSLASRAPSPGDFRAGLRTPSRALTVSETLP